MSKAVPQHARIRGNSKTQSQFRTGPLAQKPYIVHYANNVRDDLDGLNFVDDGAGQPVVFIQGNPARSFEIRHLIQGLCDVAQVGVVHRVAALAVS